MQKAAVEIEIASYKYMVKGGPHLWVSKLLQERGCLSSKKIWEEYLKDPTVEKDLIKSKKFLKERILHQMHLQGKITPARAIDIPKYSKGGWQIQQKKAFASVAPDILANITPLPELTRTDYKEYLRKNNIPHDF